MSAEGGRGLVIDCTKGKTGRINSAGESWTDRQTDGGRKAESGINWDEDECGRRGETMEFGECVGTALEVKASGG